MVEPNIHAIRGAINFCADSLSKGEKLLAWESYKVISVYGLKTMLGKFGYDVSNFQRNLSEFIASDSNAILDENNFDNILYKKPAIQQMDF